MARFVPVSDALEQIFMDSDSENEPEGFMDDDESFLHENVVTSGGDDPVADDEGSSLDILAAAAAASPTVAVQQPLPVALDQTNVEPDSDGTLPEYIS